MAPLVRVRGRHPAVIAQHLLPSNKRLWAVLYPAGSPVPDLVAFDRDRPRRKAPFIDGVAKFELEGDPEGHYHLRIYVEDLALTAIGLIMISSGGPPYYKEVTEIPRTTPSEIHVQGLRTEVLVTAGPPEVRRLPHSPALRLILDAHLTRSIQGGKSPLWAALVPEGETLPEVEFLEDLPTLAKRFVSGVLEFTALEAGRYQLRLYRVSPTWFTRHFPDRRLGRAVEVESARPRVIEIASRLTEVEITALTGR